MCSGLHTVFAPLHTVGSGMPRSNHLANLLKFVRTFVQQKRGQVAVGTNPG